MKKQHAERIHGAVVMAEETLDMLVEGGLDQRVGIAVGALTVYLAEIHALIGQELRESFDRSVSVSARKWRDASEVELPFGD